LSCFEFGAALLHPIAMRIVLMFCLCFATFADDALNFPQDPGQILERTCFQTGAPYRDVANLRSDVAICYGVDPKISERIQTWRDKGYRIHVMTGVAWGNYQDYLYGRFDGINHEDEAQTERNGKKIGHGGDVYYMCPGTNYGKFLSVGVQRALDAGAEAIHLEEPEFWVRGGYEEGFKREWKAYYNEDWQPPHSSPDAQWRASKLKYFLYRRALQQVFDHVQDYNKMSGRQVRCYVPTHSLINYAHWNIVSPESSLARINGCDGYIAQVWTGTSRTPNMYRGQLKERTFETAFLEYGAMQNLVRSTGRGVWYLNDPIEDNPNHDWNDYQHNWESTLVASLFQPEVWQYEVAPWPERIFAGKYPRRSPNAQPIPTEYGTELQIVFNALNDMKQDRLQWDCGTTGIGVLVSDSLMFERGQPNGSDSHMSHFYGLALPFLKRGMPIAPVQLENVGIEKYLDPFRVLLLSYRGQKPLTPDVHTALANWVRAGGSLVVVDDDSDPYNNVREWWNSEALKFPTPRDHLFQELHVGDLKEGEFRQIEKGGVTWLKRNPVEFAQSEANENILADAVKKRASNWSETNYLLLRRGPYIIASGLDESASTGPKTIEGRFVNLFDAGLRVQRRVTVNPASRLFLRDLDDSAQGASPVLASACKVIQIKQNSYAVEGIANTQAIVLLRSDKEPARVALDGKDLSSIEFSAADKLLWIRFPNEAAPRKLSVDY
jgi:hypothetical protein